MPQTPKRLYQQAVREYSSWTLRALTSKRVRIILRLIAVEEELQRRKAGAIPARIMTALRLLSDYKEAHNRGTFWHRGIPRSLKCDIRAEDLVLECSHPTPLAPVIAKLRKGDPSLDKGESTVGFFCSAHCARPRFLYYVIHYEPEVAP